MKKSNLSKEYLSDALEAVEKTLVQGEKDHGSDAWRITLGLTGNITHARTHLQNADIGLWKLTSTSNPIKSIPLKTRLQIATDISHAATRALMALQLFYELELDRDQPQ